MESDSSTSSEAGEKVETVEKTLELVPTTHYDDEELAHIQNNMQRMALLFALDHSDWKEDTMDIIRQFLYETNNSLLTIFYDSNQLCACLGIPLAPALDMCYFMRKPGQVFDSVTFFDEINFGTMHEDVDGCLLRVLERVFSPLFRSFSAWNDNIRLRFCKALDMFLSYLTGLHYKLEGMTILFIPYVVRQLLQKSTVRNREFVRNLEIIAVYWTTQIRNLLSDKTTPQDDFVVPAAEYEFWLYRYEVLYGLNKQLQQEDINDIITVLRNTQSVYLKQWEDLTVECAIQMQEARSNLKYLRLLIEPCNKIDEARSPEYIPELLPRIFHIMRYIWVKSEFYNRSELITKLFRQLSNQVLKFCISKINIEKVLQGHSRFGIKMANLSIDCCLSYKTIYDILSAEQSKQTPALEWNLDKAMIFNHVDAFIERLYDVIDICEAMIVFGRMVEDEEIPAPKFAGTNGAEFEKTCKRVEEKFLVVLANLESDGKELILNVNKNEWYEEVLKYRKAVKSFEETTQRLLSNVFQRICNTEEILETLNVTLFYSFRANLRTTYMREVSKLWLHFEKDMITTSNMLVDKINVHESWLPFFSSRAINYRINIERLTWLFSRITKSEWLPIVAETRIISAKFEKLKLDYERECHKAFAEWTKQCGGTTLSKKLDNSLIIRSKIKVGLLECNMDPAVLNTCEQAVHFEALGFILPGSIKKVFEKYATLKTTYNCVVKVCLDYNKILAALSMEERKLFKALVKACDRKISPGLFKLTWGGELSEVYIADCAKHTSKLQDTLDIYKRSNRNIARLCENICDTPFFKLTHLKATELHVFEETMMLYSDSAMEKIMGYYNTIIELTFAVYREFNSVIDEMTAEWAQYLQKFDDMLATAILVTCRNSLYNLLNVIHYSHEVPATPILVIKVDVVDREITLIPSMDDVLRLFKTLAVHLDVMLENLPRIATKFYLPNEAQGTTISNVYQNDQECNDLKLNIEFEIEISKRDVFKFVQVWKLYSELWEKTEESYFASLKSIDMTAKMFQETLDYYTGLTDKITLAESLSAVSFLMINQNNIKSTLLNMVENWTALILRVLQLKSTSKLKSLYRYMRSNGARALLRPRNLAELRAYGDDQLQLKQEMKKKYDDFPELYNKFDLLNQCQADLPKATRKALQQLEEEWKLYLQKLRDGEELLENTRSGFKANFLFQAERFKSIVRDFLLNFMTHLPTSSQT